MRIRRFSRIPLLLIAGVLALLVLPLGWIWAQAQQVEQVNILMPAPFADASKGLVEQFNACLLYTSPSPRDMRRSRMPSSA